MYSSTYTAYRLRFSSLSDLLCGSQEYVLFISSLPYFQHSASPHKASLENETFAALPRLQDSSDNRIIPSIPTLVSFLGLYLPLIFLFPINFLKFSWLHFSSIFSLGPIRGQLKEDRTKLVEEEQQERGRKKS